MKVIHNILLAHTPIFNAATLFNCATNIWPQTNAPLCSGANYFWAEARNNLAVRDASGG
jgi:hypothetical protein